MQAGREHTLKSGRVKQTFEQNLHCNNMHHTYWHVMACVSSRASTVSQTGLLNLHSCTVHFLWHTNGGTALSTAPNRKEQVVKAEKHSGCHGKLARHTGAKWYKL